MIHARLLKVFRPGRDSAGFRLDVTFEAAPGVTVLFGPSGSGKTLTLDCVAGFAQPDSGRILISDAIVFDSGARVCLRPQERRCGYVFQNYALFPHMTLRENLLFAAGRSRRNQRRASVAGMLERFHLEEVAGRKPHQVSGGQKQRCSIARALLSNPAVLLLDEPARGLDAPLRAELYGILKEVRTGWDLPMVMVTHSVEECFELGDRMLVMNDGQIVQRGAPSEIFARPASPEVARLLGTFNILAVEILTLDPSRNQSTLRWGEYELQGEYYPGHLKGDRVQLLATPRQLRAMPRGTSLAPNQVPLELLRVVDIASALRLEFAGGLQVETSAGAIDRVDGDWVVEFPSHGLRVI